MAITLADCLIYFWAQYQVQGLSLIHILMQCLLLVFTQYPVRDQAKYTWKNDEFFVQRTFNLLCGRSNEVLPSFSCYFGVYPHRIWEFHYIRQYIRIYTTYYLPVCFLEQRLMIFQRESYCTSHLFTLNKSGKNASQNETYYLYSLNICDVCRNMRGFLDGASALTVRHQIF